MIDKCLKSVRKNAQIVNSTTIKNIENPSSISVTNLEAVVNEVLS